MMLNACVPLAKDVAPRHTKRINSAAIFPTLLPSIHYLPKQKSHMRSQSITIVPFTQDHIDGALALSNAAGWPHTQEDWLLSLRLSKGLVAICQNRVVATALVTPCGDIATTNMIIVDQTMRGLGLGRRMLKDVMSLTAPQEWRLVATEAGYPLYQKTGFRNTGIISQHQGIVRPQDKFEGIGLSIIHADTEQLDIIAHLDRAGTGMSRKSLLQEIMKRGEIALLLDKETPAGFAAIRPFGRGSSIGPVIARSSSDAKFICQSLLSKYLGTFVRIDICAEETLSLWLEQQGLKEVARLSAMTKGSAFKPNQSINKIALASQAFG